MAVSPETCRTTRFDAEETGSPLNNLGVGSTTVGFGVRFGNGHRSGGKAW
jgi:hypothetical protein